MIIAGVQKTCIRAPRGIVAKRTRTSIWHRCPARIGYFITRLQFCIGGSFAKTGSTTSARFTIFAIPTIATGAFARTSIAAITTLLFTRIITCFTITARLARVAAADDALIVYTTPAPHTWTADIIAACPDATGTITARSAAAFTITARPGTACKNALFLFLIPRIARPAVRRRTCNC